MRWEARLIQLGVAALLGAAAWAAWLGWDNEYYFDPVVGAYQGPYRAYQVVGCALTVGLGVALLSLRWSPWVVAGGTSVGFWSVWTAHAAMTYGTGLFLVGSAMLLPGLLLGTAVAAGVGAAIRSARR